MLRKVQGVPRLLQGDQVGSLRCITDSISGSGFQFSDFVFRGGALGFWFGERTLKARTSRAALAMVSGRTSYILHSTPYTVHSSPYTLHLHPSPYTLHPTP